MLSIIESIEKVASNEFGEQNAPKGFKISATPGAFVGALVGSLVGKKSVEKNMMNQYQISQNTRNLMETDYYTQFNNLTRNLKVIFTPISVIFVVKDGPKETTIETINTDEMNEDMINAWRAKSHDYFRNLLINKMYSDIQLAEKLFAKKVIERHNGIKEGILKKAFDIGEVDDMTDVEIAHHASEAKGFFSKNSDISMKVAAELITDIDDGFEYAVTGSVLDRPFDKYAGAITNPLNMLGFQIGSKKMDSLQGRYLDPKYLKSKVKVGFFPDRVIFSVDDRLVSTLPVMYMSEEGMVNFKNHDKIFFKDLFHKEVKKGVARLGDKTELSSTIDKRAEEEVVDNKNIYYKNDINPVVYFLSLTAKYGYEWVDFNAASLIVAIERDFELTEPISDIAINKILSIKASNNGDAVYSSRHAFEKVIRSFNDKPINFRERENDDLELIDFVSGLDILNRITPYDNVYDNFSSEIFDYIVKTLVDNNTLVWGVTVNSTVEESQFVEILNMSMLHETNKRLTNSSLDQKSVDSIIKENEFVSENSRKIISILSDSKGESINDTINDMTKSLGVSERVQGIIKSQVIKNLSVDESLDHKEELLYNQLREVGLYNN